MIKGDIYIAKLKVLTIIISGVQIREKELVKKTFTYLSLFGLVFRKVVYRGHDIYIRVGEPLHKILPQLWLFLTVIFSMT